MLQEVAGQFGEKGAEWMRHIRNAANRAGIDIGQDMTNAMSTASDAIENTATDTSAVLKAITEGGITANLEITEDAMEKLTLTADDMKLKLTDIAEDGSETLTRIVTDGIVATDTPQTLSLIHI